MTAPAVAEAQPAPALAAARGELRTPSIEHLEECAELVRREAVALVEHARELSTRESKLPQDVHLARLGYELRTLKRRLTLAQCELVRSDDPRRPAADRVAAELRKQHDYPWGGLVSAEDAE